MRNRKAFTLIELLVVIAILAILAAILYPVFARAKQKSQYASCQSNLKRGADGLKMYANDHDDRLPPNEVLKAKDPLWLKDYYLSQPFEEYACPSDFAKDHTGEYVYRGYGYNLTFRNLLTKGTGEKVLIWDGVNLKNEGAVKQVVEQTEDSELPSFFTEDDPEWVDWGRHGAEKANIAFFDGHVKLMARKSAKPSSFIP